MNIDRTRESVLERSRTHFFRTLGLTAKCATADSTPTSSLLDGMSGGPGSDSTGKLKPGAQMPPSSPKRKRAPPTKKKKPVPKGPPMQPLEMVGVTSRMVTQELMQIEDGLGLTIVQPICDNHTQMKEGDQSFMVRHNFNYDGPQGCVMNGGMRGYSASFEAMKKRNYNLSANWQGPMMIGMFEKTWNPYLSTTAQFELCNSAMPQMAMMFPSFNISTDCKTESRSARLHVAKIPYSPGTNTSISLMNKVGKGLSLGAKVSANFEARTSSFEIGAKYRVPVKKDLTHTFEGLWNVTAGSYKAWYTKHLDYRVALTAGLEMQPSARKAVGTFGYKYVFGSRMMPTTLVGSINSNMMFKQALSFPLTQAVLFRVHGQMNHMNANLQQMRFPNIFGCSLMLQI